MRQLWQPHGIDNKKNTNLMIIKSFNNNLFYILLFSCISFYAYGNGTFLEQSIIDHQKNPSITAAIPANFPPFYYTDGSGLPYGMGVEVLNEIDHKAGYLTHFIVKRNWTDVFSAIDSGEAQVIPNLGITEARKKLYFFSKPYAETKITVFTRTDNIITSEVELRNLHIGVVKNNAGRKIAIQNNYANRHVYDSVTLAFEALQNKKIDALIYPKLIARNTVERSDIHHLIYDTNITLKTIYRGLAVSKRHPEIFEKLNASLELYMDSQDFTDTYAAWYGNKPAYFSNTELIVFNIAIFIIIIFIFNYFWNKKYFSILKQNRENHSKWIIYLIAILIVATSIVSLSISWLLYEISFNEQRLRLVDSVKSRARLIEAVARYDKKGHKLYPHSDAHPSTGISERTISQVIDAHENFHGFGETGEFTFARKNNDAIEFVLRQRHRDTLKPEPIPFNSKLAMPMRLALLGHSGTIVGQDYRGQQVLAAYEPVSILNMGIVAKIDLDEIRAPFISSAIYISTIVFLISFFSSLLFFYILLPFIKKIQNSESRFRQLFVNNFTPALLVSAKNAIILDANTSAIEFYGYSLEEICARKLNVLSVDPYINLVDRLKRVHLKKGYSITTQQRLQNGDIKDVEILASLIEIDNDIVIYCTIIDITKRLKKELEHQRLEKELTQARKMEALGQLTGGIAHDFNNMLGVIMGYSELSRDKIANNDNEKIPGYLDQVLAASNRAKELISSMMLFSHSGENDAEAINISPLVKEDIKMLRSIIPTSIDIITQIDEDLPAVMIEPVKLQQLIMNLCVNARDAMDSKGTLTITLRLNNDIHDSCLICYKQIRGDWVELCISDTGSGMTEQIKQHLFEPFFTTKDKGKGTGMGMAVVHGIVQELNGHILIDTKIGEGSTIRILFPPADTQQDVVIEVHKEVPARDEHHKKRILIVDDETSLTKLLGDMLSSEGFQCTLFSSPADALAEFKKSPDNYDLILSDQTMPNLSGLEMITAMREIRENIPAMIATGFSTSINETSADINNIKLMKKPLTKDLLLKNISEIFKNN